MRRPPLQAILALLLAAAFASPAAAAGPAGASTDGRETLTGVLEAYYLDDFPPRGDAQGDAHATDRLRWSLRTADGTVRVDFPGQGPRRLSGATVTLIGDRDGGVLRVATTRTGADLRVRREAAPSVVARAASSSTVATSFAVVLINFTNLTTEPWTKATVKNAVTDSATSLKAFYEEESKGDLTLGASVYGWYTIDATTTGCDWQDWQEKGWDAAVGAGVNLSSFTNVMFISPYTSACGFAGVGYVPGSATYLNGTISVQVMAHEVGHNFGLAHANARTCTVSGTRVTIAADGSCSTQVYADPFSVMGNQFLRHNHGSQLGELGWLSASQKVVGSPGHTYTISPYFASGTVKLVRIPRGDGTFFDLDLRTATGPFDTFAAGSPAVSGVTVRLGRGTASPTWSPQATELLDATPATTDLKDAPLLPGSSITDPVSTITIATESVGTGGATVRVTEAIAPGAPGSLVATVYGDPSVGLDWTAASDNVAVGGYRVSRDGVEVASLGAGARTWIDDAVAIGQRHDYAVTAIDTSDNAGPAATVSVDVTAGGPPPPVDTVAPGRPGNVHAKHRTRHRVTLRWSAATDNVGVVRYAVYRVGRSKPMASTTSRHARFRYVAGATYVVRAFDAAGNRGPASTRVRIR